jgi:hypothetical protein
MSVDPRNAASERNWRLRAELDADLGGSDTAGLLEGLIGSLRRPSELSKIEASVPRDVVITHDGKLLFAYASDEGELSATRRALEGVSERDGLDVKGISVSHWDGELDDWRQIDPPPEGEARRSEETAERDAETVETRTLVVSSGNLIRVEFERSLQEWASELGVECKVIDHPHLLSSQVGFTVTGSKRKLDEFAEGLRAEERATIRTETQVMLSPL